MGGLSDFEACPGRGRVVVQKAPNELSGPDGCPGKGPDRQLAFWGGGRGGKDDKPPDNWVIGQGVGFETCVKGFDVVKGTELGVVTRTELDVAIAELDSLEKYKAIQGSSLHIFPTEEVLCFQLIISKQRKYFA